MNEHTCRCGLHFPVHEANTVSRHRTSGGVVAYVRCPAGHLGVVTLGEQRVVPERCAA